MWRFRGSAFKVNAAMRVDDVEVRVTYKRIKNYYLKVSREDGVIHISAPFGASVESLKEFVQSKSEWITKHQATVGAGGAIQLPGFEDGELHKVWGKEIPLLNKAVPGACLIKHRAGALLLQSPEGTPVDKKEKLLSSWYKQEVKRVASSCIKKWETTIGVKAGQISVQRMKSRWGSCNVSNANIRLNSELAKYQEAVLEHVVVHELVHLLEPSHSKRFYSLMDEFLPNWRDLKALTNDPQNSKTEVHQATIAKIQNREET